MHRQPVPSPTHRGMGWFNEEGESGREVVSGDAGQAASTVWVQPAFLIFILFLFMIYFRILHNHTTFQKFFTFHKPCDLCSVLIYVTYDATTCSIIAGGVTQCRHPVPVAGTRSLLPSSQQELRIATLPWYLMPQTFLPSSRIFLALGKLFCAGDELWPVCSSGAGAKCPNPQQRVGAAGSGGWLSLL